MPILCVRSRAQRVNHKHKSIVNHFFLHQEPHVVKLLQLNSSCNLVLISWTWSEAQWAGLNICKKIDKLRSPLGHFQWLHPSSDSWSPSDTLRVLLWHCCGQFGLHPSTVLSQAMWLECVCATQVSTKETWKPFWYGQPKKEVLATWVAAGLGCERSGSKAWCCSTEHVVF